MKKLLLQIIDTMIIFANWLKKRILSFPAFFQNNSNWLPLITYTIALSGFWNLLGYFSPHVSFEIDKLISGVSEKYIQENEECFFDTKQFRKFYKINNLNLPISLFNNSAIRRIFDPTKEEQIEKKEDSLNNLYSDATPDIEYLNSIREREKNNRKGLDLFSSFRCRLLEKQLDKLHWHQGIGPVTIISKGIGGIDEKRLGEFIKKQSSEYDYYKYLCALLYATTVINHFSFTNNSEITLEEIKIIIPSPDSKLIGNNTDNILKFQYFFMIFLSML